MNGKRTACVLLGSIAVAAGFVGSQGWLRGAEPLVAPAVAAAPVSSQDRETTGSPAPDDGTAGRAAAAGRQAEGVSPEQEAGRAELLAVLHACMASPALRPAPGAKLDLRVDRRLMEDCLRGSDALDVLKRLSASLATLGASDREDAALLMGYLARRLLRDAPTMAERAAVIGPVLEGYRTIEGSRLREIADWLLLDAYGGKEDPPGAAQELRLALERELEADAVPHTLGPILGMSGFSSRKHKLRDSHVSGDAFDAMKDAAERAIPRAVELALAAVRSETPPDELRDALLLLDSAFDAASRESASLREALPRVLDGLAELDASRIRASGVAVRRLNLLLSETEAWVMRTGGSGFNEAPPGGRTSPGDLRRRWGVEARDFRAGASGSWRKVDQPAPPVLGPLN